jgi:hypothetical protein
MERLDQRWQDVISWPFPDSSSDPTVCDSQHSVRGFVEMWVRAFRGDKLGLGRFTSNPLIIEVAEDMLAKRLKESDRPHLSDLVQDLTIEMYTKLHGNVWLPTPEMLREEIREELRHFLARRVDWDAVLFRSAISTKFIDEIFEMDEKGERRQKRSRRHRRPRDSAEDYDD